MSIEERKVKMAYPVMYLVRDLMDNTLFRSNDLNQAKSWARNAIKRRSKHANKHNPLCIVKSQLITIY